jgi:outer membrane protein assembly factor BamB
MPVQAMWYRWLAAAMCLFFGAGWLAAGNWPAWRGPTGDGLSTESGIATHWGPDDNIAWKVPVPGKGHSSPVVWGDRIFLTTCIESAQTRDLFCLEQRTGKTLWHRQVLSAKLEPKHALNSYASSTPATDGLYVWVSFLNYPNMEVFCFDMDGKSVWHVTAGTFYSRHGFCSPPIPYQDTVILNGDQDGDGYLVALEKTTGKERWRASRPNHTRSYCPPILFESGQRRQLALSGSKCVASYDPDTGRELWRIDGPTEQFVASLVFSKGVLFLTAGFPEYHIMAIRPDGSGNVTKTHVLWRDTRGAGYVPSPISHGSYFFLVSDSGLASCLDAHTGHRFWMEHLGRHHSASPVCAGEYLYFPDDDGNTFVIKAGPKFELVAKNALAEECYASPAIAQGQLFIRTLHHLYCIGGTSRGAALGR